MLTKFYFRQQMFTPPSLSPPSLSLPPPVSASLPPSVCSRKLLYCITLPFVHTYCHYFETLTIFEGCFHLFYLFCFPHYRVVFPFTISKTLIYLHIHTDDEDVFFTYIVERPNHFSTFHEKNVIYWYTTSLMYSLQSAKPIF